MNDDVSEGFILFFEIGIYVAVLHFYYLGDMYYEHSRAGMICLRSRKGKL